jgi:hypothetical protein
MSVLQRLMVLCLAMSVIGCGVAKTWATYELTVRNAHADLPLAKEFAALFPDTAEAITYFPSDKPYWRAEAGVYDRYCISMRFPITHSASGTHSSQAGEPKFVLAEIESIHRLPDGRLDIAYGRAHEFGLQEWNVLVKAKGDLSSLGIDVVKDKPIADFSTMRC